MSPFSSFQAWVIVASAVATALASVGTCAATWRRVRYDRRRDRREVRQVELLRTKLGWVLVACGESRDDASKVRDIRELARQGLWGASG